MINLFARKYIEHPVTTKEGVKTLKFYAICPRVAGQLKNYVKPIFTALATFMASTANDIGREVVDTRGSGDESQSRTTVQPISVELMKARSSQRNDAINSLIEAMLSEGAMMQLAILIQDSLQDEFPNRGKVAAEVTSFIDSVGMDTVAELLQGVAKANEELLAPLIKKLGYLEKIFQRATDRILETGEGEESKAPIDTSSPKMTTGMS